MHYFLYLRRSLTRAWREHLLLLVVMTLAFALPLGMSVLAESCRYGGEQWYIAVTKGGYPVRIANVSAKDAAFFDSLDGFTPIYSAEEEVMFLDPDPQLQFGKNTEELMEFINRLRTVFAQIAAAGGNPSLVEEIYGTYSENPLIAQYRMFVFVLLAFSAVTQCAFYLLYLHRHTKDLGALLSSGATRGQLTLLTAAHLGSILLLAAGISLLVSIGGMRLLINAYFSGMSDTNYWILFHCTPSMICGICLVCFVVPLLFGVICVYAMTARPIRELLGTDVSGEKLRHDRRVLTARPRPAALLSGMFRRRCGSRSRICFAILFPVVTFLLFLAVYEGAQCLYAFQAPRVDIRVNSSARPPCFSEEEIARILETADTASYGAKHSLARFAFTLYEPPKKSNGPRTNSFPGMVSEKMESPPQIFLRRGDASVPRGSESSQNEEGKPVYHAIVHTNGVSWKVGEQKQINQMETGMDGFKVGSTLLTDSFFVIADQVIKSEEVSQGDAEVYLYSDTYDAFVAELEISSLDLTLRDAEKHLEATAALRALADEIPMNVIDHSRTAKITLQRTKGEAIYAGLVIALLCVFYTTLVRAVLIEYMRSQRANMRTLHALGTDPRTLRQAYIRQMLVIAVMVLLAVSVVCTALLLLYAGSDAFARLKMAAVPPILYIVLFTAASGYTVASMVLPIRAYMSRQRDGSL